MPFFPVIAGGADPFGGIAAQQQYWAGLSNRIDEGNLARYAQAQEAGNRWLAQAAQMRDAALNRDIQAQLNQDAIDRQLALRQQEMGEAARQFGVTATLNRERTAAEDRRTRAMYGGVEADRQRQLASIENAGNFLQPEVDAAGQKMDKALEDYNKEAETFATLRMELERGLPGTWDPKLKEFKSAFDATPEQKTQVAKANEDLAKGRAAFDAAGLAYQTHMANFDTAVKSASQSGLQVGKRNGRYVLFSPNHPGGGKTFGEMVREAAPVATAPVAKPEYDLPGILNSLQGPSVPEVPWAGFTRATGTTPPAAAPVPTAEAMTPPVVFRGHGAGGTWDVAPPPTTDLSALVAPPPPEMPWTTVPQVVEGMPPAAPVPVPAAGPEVGPGGYIKYTPRTYTIQPRPDTAALSDERNRATGEAIKRGLRFLGGGNLAAAEAMTPPAPRDPAMRTFGKAYQVPGKGIFRWMPDGWWPLQ